MRIRAPERAPIVVISITRSRDSAERTSAASAEARSGSRASSPSTDRSYAQDAAPHRNRAARPGLAVGDAAARPPRSRHWSAVAQVARVIHARLVVCQLPRLVDVVEALGI